MKKKRTVSPALLVPVLMILCFCLLTARLEEERAALGQQQLEDALRRGAVACYAQEGFYPPDLCDLQSRCGISYDTQQYAVHYEIFASNLMPDITVWERKP